MDQRYQELETLLGQVMSTRKQKKLIGRVALGLCAATLAAFLTGSAFLPWIALGLTVAAAGMFLLACRRHQAVCDQSRALSRELRIGEVDTP